MKNLILLLLIAVVHGVCASSLKAQTSFTGKPQYTIIVKRSDTLMGNIVVEMFPAIAPNHVRNWDSLVNIKFFDSIAFHRVIPGFMIQGGDPNSKSGPRDTWGYGGSETILDAEFNSVSHRRGILSAARTDDPHSASSQFFICVANYPSLDRQYSVYGKVVSGMVVADSIVKAKRDANDNPFDKISMFISRTGLNDSITEVPQLVYPLSNTFTVSNTQLRWNKVNDAMIYRVQVATDSQFQTLFLDTSMRQIDTSVRLKNLEQLTTYYWRVLANNGGNESPYSSVRDFTVESLSAEFANNFKIEFNAYPNPAKESTTISFNLSDPSNVTLTVLDILGRNVLTLIDSKLLPRGKNKIPFTRGTLPAGVYIYRLEAEGKSISKHVVFE